MSRLPESLTEAQKEVLRLFYRRFGAGEIARELDISTTAVTERLRSARAKMNVSSSAEAARRLHEYEGEQPTKTDVDIELGVTPPPESPSSLPSSRPPWPWRTRSRPTNDLTLWQKVALIIALTAIIMVAMGIYLLGVQALSSLV
ncbi:MAG TPA: LuxR C-terminal-related transcriptional regulator [Allosphingosinicella sp.]|nr:LuxR C-terminal-related transcriptional regulator [Allosphingosinicella sp.]